MISDFWVWAAVFARFFLYAGTLIAIGSVLVSLAFPNEVRGREKALRQGAVILSILALAAAFVAYGIRGAALVGDASGLTDPEMLSILWQTPVGDVLIWQTVGLAALIAGCVLGGPGLWIAAVAGVAVLWSFAQLGHVADQGQMMLQILLVLHLASVAMWIGVLAPLTRLAASDRPQAAELGHKFGIVAVWFLPVLVLAGVWMTWTMAGSIAAITGTPYGWVLIAKLGLVVGLLALGAMNKLRHVPALRRGEDAAARRLRTTIAVEWGVFLAILLVTSILTTAVTPP